VSTEGRVLVKEKIAESGVALLRERFDVDLGLDWDDTELAERLREYDAILIRSATQLDAALIGHGERLRAIGRAGIGVDNVDIEAATKRGIVVVNAPTSNIVAAAEHTIALMLALARNIPQAHGSLTEGRWERSRFGGVEVYEKTLGVLGFGRIGQLVAHRARGFGMRVLAFDPFVSGERFRELGAEKAESSAALYEQADFITVHLPRTPETRGWLDAEAFAQMKDGVRVINCARGELVVDDALKDALDSGRVAGAALDVYSQEPITDHPLFSGYDNVVVTPHLGASTAEAQDRVGLEMAEQVLMALSGVTPPYAVNAPAVAPETAPRLRPYVELGRRLAILARQLAPSAYDVLSLTYAGEIAGGECAPIRTAALAGILEAVTDQRVNAVNADLVARERGLTVREERTPSSDPWASLVELAVGPVDGEPILRLAGSTAHGRPHLAGLDGFAIDAELTGTMLVTRHHDRPGIVGAVGTILAEAGINISSLELSRLSEHGEAMMCVSVDETIEDAVLDRIRAADGIVEVRVVQLPSP
jgi:D-3-phosphoglycerate dehydrogenase / 2-oxoglutarate reductase